MESPLDLTFGESLNAFLDTAEDFHKHRKRINRRIRRLRHDLDIVTRDTKNYKAKEKQTKITSEDYDKDPRFGILLILTAERDYAYSRELKYLMEIGNESAGSYKNLMASRIKRSLHNAKKLLEISQGEANKTYRLELFVYAALLQGVYSTNKRHWEAAVNALSIARCGLECIQGQQRQEKEEEEAKEGADSFDADQDNRYYIKELVDSIVDPTLNLAVSQLDSISNTDLKSISRKHCKDNVLKYLEPSVALIKSIDPQYVTELGVSEDGDNLQESLIKSIQWRDHEATIMNEEIAYKIMGLNKIDINGFTANDFDEKLVSQWSYILDLHENDNINKDEDDLDVVQSRAILSTYIQYQELFAKLKRDLLFIKEISANKENSSGHVSRLELNKDIYWLLNSIVSTVQALKDLPGVYNDEELYKSINNLENYFAGQKTSRLAESFAINESFSDALKVYSHIKEEILPKDAGKVYSVEFPYRVTDNEEYQHFYKAFNKKFRQVHILTQFTRDLKSPTASSTVIDNVNKYPINSKLDNIIKLSGSASIEPILNKPVLFDIGYNYINYDAGRSKSYAPAPAAPSAGSAGAGDDTKQQKSGFFGIFGRS